MIEIFIGILAILILFVILKILSISLPLIIKLVWNGIIGLITLVIFNLIGGIFGLTLELTFLNTIVAGIFGIPGIILLLIFQ